jgi:addiction module toxin, txe/yoeB family
VEKLINLIKKNPFQTPPSYEILTKDLKGYYSRRINKQHRLVYEVIARREKNKYH